METSAWEWVLFVVIVIGIGALVYHKANAKKDGKTFLGRYTGGRVGTKKEK